MKFIASSSELLVHLQSMSRVISTKNTLPILDCFLFNLKGNTLTLTASDLESTIVSEMSIENSDGDGCIAIPARILTETVKGLSNQPITFDINLDNGLVDILSENGKYSIPGQFGIDYPALPNIDKATYQGFTIGANILLVGINKTLFGTADDELRPVMGGIFVEAGKDNISFTASDGHKLVNYKRTDTTFDNVSSFILPRKPAGLLKNILAKESAEVSVEVDKRNAFFAFNNYKVVCRLTEGNYPNYRSVIPTDNKHKIVVDKASFLNSLKRVAVFANKASNMVKLKIEGTEIIVSAQDIDFSISAYEKIACEGEKGFDIEIGFKSNFILEILSNIATKDVVISLSDSQHAGLFLPVEENETEDLLMLLMPMMINA